MFKDNLIMTEAMCTALARSPVAHVVNISSDAVYSDEPLLNERSCASPTSLHGMMHLTRELLFRTAATAPLAILRPSLLYGVADPHNGYGPNRFRRLAAEGSHITLFGEGEEQRDHVLVDDLAELIRLCLLQRSHGVLNVATGVVTSFKEIAELVAGHFDPPPAIMGSPRQGPMPHDGYRAFSTAACAEAFPDFHYTSLAEGLAVCHELMMEER
jgi:nucleoside-diphosphate-sugar epimerase